MNKSRFLNLSAGIMHRSIFFTLINLFSFQLVFSQIQWRKVDSVYQPLPLSVHVYRAEDSLNGKLFVGYYLAAKLKDRKLNFDVRIGEGKRFTPSQYYLREHFPLVVLNGGYFSMVTNENLGVIIRHGKLLAFNTTSLKGAGRDSTLYYYITRSAIGIDKKRNADVAWVFTVPGKHKVYAFESAPVMAKNEYTHPDIFDLKDVDWKWWKMQTAIGGGPTLLHDGEIAISDIEEQVPGGNKPNARTAIGYTLDGRLIILVTQGTDAGNQDGVTFGEEAKILKDIGCTEALNLDGGKSSCLLINGKETIKPADKRGEAEVASVFLIYLQ